MNIGTPIGIEDEGIIGDPDHPKITWIEVAIPTQEFVGDAPTTPAQGGQNDGNGNRKPPIRENNGDSNLISAHYPKRND